MRYHPATLEEPGYYEEEDRECPFCDDKDDTLELIKKRVLELSDQIYSQDSFDEERFQTTLEKLRSILFIREEYKKVNIQRKEKKISYIDEWIQFNAHYNNSLMA